MKILNWTCILFLVEQNFITKQNDYITFKLISAKKNPSALIHVNKVYEKKVNVNKNSKSVVNKNFNILLKKLQKIS